MTAATQPKAKPPRGRRGLGIALLSLALVLSVLLASARLMPLSSQGRTLIERTVSGREVGRLGRLEIRGITGDVWSDFEIAQLTLSDQRGVWLSADKLRVEWSSLELLGRRVHLQRLGVNKLWVLRRPVLGAAKPRKKAPVSVAIDAISARVEMAPAFSYRRGLFDLTGRLSVIRGEGPVARVKAVSLLHAGDYLDANLNLADARRLMIKTDIVEAQGGALAGALGLPADLPFRVHADVGGETAKGKILVTATSGEVWPISIDGGWTAAGGSAKGRVLLSASSLTQGLAARLGPELSFQGSAWRTNSPFLDLSGRLATAKLQVVGQGRGDIAKGITGAGGISIAATTSRLSDLTGGPTVGAASLKGVIKGRLESWDFDGLAEANQIGVDVYQLSGVSGPIRLSRAQRQWNLSGVLSGQGGRGAGLAAALLGAAPVAEFDGARLADGRLSLKNLEIAGAGLKLKATGSRGLLGGLNLEGQAQLSNLAMARSGAGGEVLANWTASQSGPGKPWALSADAKGAKFATGYSEIDRLVGSTPQLRVLGDVSQDRANFRDISLQGAGLRIGSEGAIARDGALRFQLDWTADGPFHAGPVAIVGKAKGAGAVSGTLDAPRADLIADFDEIDVPRLPLKDAHLTLSWLRTAEGVGGPVELKAMSAYGPAEARASMRFPGEGLELTDLSVNAGGVLATGSLALRGGGGSRADLNIEVAKGAFLDGGRVSGFARVVDAPGGAVAHVDVAARNAYLPGRSLAIGQGRLVADGPLSRLPYTLNASGVSAAEKWTIAGRGQLSQLEPDWRANFEGEGRYGTRVLKTTEPALFDFGPKTLTSRLRLSAGGGGLVAVDSTFVGQDAQLSAAIQNLSMSVVDPDLTGQVDAKLQLKGRGQALGGDFSAVLEGVRGKGANPSEGLGGTLSGQLTGSELKLGGLLTNGQGLKATADLILAAEASAAPFRVAINRTKPLRGTVFADGEVRPLWDLFVGGQRELAGQVRLNGTLGGTLADIRANGEAVVRSGRFTDASTGLVLQDVGLIARLTDNAIDIREAQGVDPKGGTVAGQGKISLERAGQSTLRLDLRGFRLIDNSLATATATGQVTLDRNADGRARLAGGLTIDRADIAARAPVPSGVTSMEVIEINRPVDLAGLVPSSSQAKAAGVALDVDLKAQRRVFVKGRGLDVELSLVSHVGGTTSSPRLTGVARVVRGDYDFAGKRFNFDERGVIHLATNPRDIHLDLSATRDDPSLTAVVQIRGTAAKPEITLTSRPALPNDEVLSQVLFGRSASQLSPLEAAQLASALSSLAGGGGFDVIGNLRTFAGLDRLSLGGGGQAGVTVSGGKYLTDDVYLELTGGGRNSTSAQVEWRIGRSLSILSKIAGQGDGKLAVRWRRDY